MLFCLEEIVKNVCELGYMHSIFVDFPFVGKIANILESLN